MSEIISLDVLKGMPLPRYGREASKSDYGKLLIVAGSRRLPGAAILAARAALRTGCGTVRVAVPESVATAIGVALPELMVIPLPETQSGTASLRALDTIRAQYDRCDAVVAGPGLDENDETASLCRALIEELPLPMVVDASALSVFSSSQAGQRAPRVLTPHAAEMAALISEDVTKVEKDREKIASEFARIRGVTLVLKGAETLVAGNDDAGWGRLLRNRAGTRGMGTAGSGDVLSGVIGSLLTQKMTALAAATWGVHLHALAGEAGAASFGDDGMIASDLIEQLPHVMRRLRAATEGTGSATSGFI